MAAPKTPADGGRRDGHAGGVANQGARFVHGTLEPHHFREEGNLELLLDLLLARFQLFVGTSVSWDSFRPSLGHIGISWGRGSEAKVAVVHEGKDSRKAPVASQAFKRRSESGLTYALKWAAWEWLYCVAGCRCIGFEVKLEGPGGRVVDLAAVGPGNTFYIIEVKASRADFARDNHTPSDLTSLKEQNEPLLRRGRLARRTLNQATQYAQTSRPQDWELEPSYQLALADYQRLLKEEQNYRDRVATFSVKFHDPAFLGIADYHYIMAPRRLLPAKQLPPQWGLLNELPDVVAPAARKEVRKNSGIVSNFLRGIARSNSTSMMRAQGVLFTQDGAVFPHEPEWEG